MKKEFLLLVAAVVLLLSLAIPVGAVTCDIKPGTWPNDINLDSHGVIPVAILGSADFDVSQIDPSTLEFECAKASKWNTSDVDGDGYMDLIAKFKTQQTCIVPGQTEATISWALYDGTEMSCSDSIQTVLAGNLPDLIVSKLAVVSFTATTISYSYTIKNVGTAPANLDGPTSAESDNVSVQAFLSQDTVFNNAGDIPAGGTILGLSPLGMLNPGDTFTGSFSSGVSQDPATFSYLTLMVDWGNVVAESDETNNTAAAPIVLLPDLVVTALSVTSYTATTISYSYTIKNVGTAPANLDGPTSAESDNVSVQAFLSQDTVFNNAGDIPAGGTILGLSPLGMLNPGDTFTGSFSSGVSQDPATFSYLTLMVDWGNVVAESDETNNTAAAPMP